MNWIIALTFLGAHDGPAQDRFVQMLLHRNQLQICHQINYVNAKVNLVEQRNNTTDQNQIRRIAKLINALDRKLNPARRRLINSIARTGQAIVSLKRAADRIPKPVIDQIDKTFAQQVFQEQDIINQRASTPCVPCSCGFMPIQRHFRKGD